jgi:hypothetical protein
MNKLFAMAVVAGACSVAAVGADLRVGIIGTDTSHAIAFTQILNDPSFRDHVNGAKVVAAFPGGSPDLESSRTRVQGYADELKTKWGVEIVSDIPTLCSKVDAILLESVDGRKHLEQLKLAVAARKPIFIDKPLASTLADAREIARIAKAAGVPWFSSSSLRYASLVTTMKFADARGAITWGPGPLDATHQLDLSWYSIHAVEMLYALLGTGCEEVTRMRTPDGDVITGRWSGGRTGTVRTIRPYGDYGTVVFRPKTVVVSPSKVEVDYHALVAQIVEFFNTGKPPVPNEETLELFAFMDAAQRSGAEGGKPVVLARPQAR